MQEAYGSVDQRATPVLRGIEPQLDPGERSLFERVMSRRKSYLEFGMGGSTLVAARSDFETIISVDSDLAWVTAVRGQPEIKNRIDSGTLSILWADIGPVGGWGMPIDDTQRASWPEYVRVAWSECARKDVSPDLVFVDGRFRVACCLSTIFATRLQTPFDRMPLVMIRDVDDARPYYKILFKYFDVVETSGTLHLLRWRMTASASEAFDDFLRYQFDPR